MPDTEHHSPEEIEALPLGTRPIRAVRESATTLLRQCLALLGLFFIIIGVPIAVMTPFPFIPIGLPIVILGVVLLGRNSVWGRNWMEGILRRYPKVEKFAPNWLMKLVFGRDKRPAFRKREKPPKS